MRRGLAHAAVFAAILLVIFAALDHVVTQGLRKSELSLYAEWNDIVSGEAGADIIIQGSSRAWVQFSPTIIGDRLGMTCYNLGVDGYPLDMELARYRLYQKYNRKPKIIVQCLDTYSLNIRDNLYHSNQFLPYLNEPAIRDGVEPYGYFNWPERNLPLVRYRGKMDLVYKGVFEFFGIRHYTNERDRGYQAQDRRWTAEFDEFVAKHPGGIDQKYLQSMIDEFDDFLAECTREGITVVLVYPPEYIEAQRMVNNREEIFTIFRQLAQKHGLAFIDYSDDPLSLDTKYFYNSQHLNKLGAEQFSARFADTLAEVVDSGGRVADEPQ